MRANTVRGEAVQSLSVPASADAHQPTDRASKSIYYVVAAILGFASIALSATYAASRGLDTLSSCIWASIGAALALALLIAPSEIVCRARRRDFAGMAAAVVLTLAAALFVLTGALGNASAGRTATATASTESEDSRSRAQRQHDEAVAALNRLEASRTLGEIESSIAALNLKIGAIECAGWVASKATRQACAERLTLEAERARAERRSELEARRDDARKALDTPTTVRPANADAAILARFLALMGVQVSADQLTDWLSLIAVAGVELGGALCVILARSTAAPALAAPHVPSAQIPPGNVAVPAFTDSPTPIATIPLFPQVEHDLAQERRNAIVERLKAGPIVGSQRQIASQLGTPLTSLRRIAEHDRSIRFADGRLELVG